MKKRNNSVVSLWSLLAFAFIASTLYSKGEGEDENHQNYKVDVKIRCDYSDYLIVLPVYCGKDVKEIFSSVDVGLILKAVIVDGQPVKGREVLIHDLSLNKVENESSFASYTINLNGLASYENGKNDNIGELKSFLYDIPERPKKVELVYYSRATNDDPVLCRAVLLFDGK